MTTNDDRLFRRFREQRDTARQTRIEWQLEYSEWLQIWPAAT